MRTRLVTTLVMVMSVLVSGQALTQPRLPNFQSGDVLRADDLNRIVDQVRQNMNAAGGNGGATHTVNCSSGTIAAAMAQAQPGDTIRISGRCREAVVVDKDGITLDGRGSAVIDGSGVDATVIKIAGHQNVTVKGLTVQNGLNGIKIVEGAAAWLENVTVRGSRAKAGHDSGRGILIASSSNAVLTGDIVANDNAHDGIRVAQGGRASVVGNLALEGGRVSQASLQANGNGVFGIAVSLGSSLEVYASDGAYTTVQANNNGSQGIELWNGSAAQFGPGASIEATDNEGTGLWIADNSSAVFIGWSVNTRGFTGTFNSNGGDGIFLFTSSLLSAYDNGAVGGITVANNMSTGIHSSNGSSVALFTNTNVTNNSVRDVGAWFGSRLHLEGSTVGTIACDGSVLSAGDTMCPRS